MRNESCSSSSVNSNDGGHTINAGVLLFFFYEKKPSPFINHEWKTNSNLNKSIKISVDFVLSLLPPSAFYSMYGIKTWNGEREREKTNRKIDCNGVNSENNRKILNFLLNFHCLADVFGRVCLHDIRIFIFSNSLFLHFEHIWMSIERKDTKV